MFHTLERSTAGILAVALSLALAGPARAADRQSHLPGYATGRSAVVTSRPAGGWLALLAQIGRSIPSANLLAVWLGDGPVLDPDGKPLPPSPRPSVVAPDRAGEPVQLE